ncbi:NADase-type glycan-binding domain-containing protein [Leptospira levettii]|uniref:NAD glycohydrolase translocation F5/8 type C domain-containing protein n=1 Tax=Leptospira levettii TaxID=2023178 RepID=A0AAW5VCT3_9LEPT|nr:hypothetical protein [Leptospira levettii]MCW7466670.1 hypothetical protein [Leptospira levettii]MCW7511764.1 hypothetical protein [Leptospira levettii]MCW7515524.1 hypothetical protein [Leptospira levettii]
MDLFFFIQFKMFLFATTSKIRNQKPTLSTFSHHFRTFVSIFLLIFLIHCKASEKQLDYEKTQSVGQVSPEEPWRFSPEFALDEKYGTAFCANAKEIGSGFTLFLANQTKFTALQLLNGYHRSANDLKANDMIKKLRVSSFWMEKNDTKNQFKLDRTKDIELSKAKFGKQGLQILDLDSTFEGNVIRFEILETYGLGTTGRVCLSEVKMGEILKDSFSASPWVSFDKVKLAISQFVKAERHAYGFKQLVLANEKGTILFYDQGTVLPVFFKPDQTFSFSEMYGEGDPTSFLPSLIGTYTILQATEEGLEINLSYFDQGGIERNISWIFKRAEVGDEDYENFKTKLGTKFSEVYQPKTHFLFVLKEKETGRTFYHYELPIPK